MEINHMIQITDKNTTEEEKEQKIKEIRKKLVNVNEGVWDFGVLRGYNCNFEWGVYIDCNNEKTKERILKILE